MLGAEPAAVTQFGRWLSGNALVRVPGKGVSEEKSANGWVALGRSAAVGTITSGDGIPWRTRRPSYEVKKKVWFFLIGPPNVPPNWFWLNCGLSQGTPSIAGKQYGLAFSLVLRKNSYTFP